jgi:uncharacterized membrane protein YhiD involved in acid resistance
MGKIILGLTVYAWTWIAYCLGLAAVVYFYGQEPWLAWLFVAGVIFGIRSTRKLIKGHRNDDQQ